VTDNIAIFLHAVAQTLQKTWCWNSASTCSSMRWWRPSFYVDFFVDLPSVHLDMKAILMHGCTLHPANERDKGRTLI